MRVGYVSCDPGVSVFGSTGSSVHITEICTALGTLGHEVFVLSARRGGLPSARPTFDVHEIEIAPIHRLSSRILRSLSSAWNTHNVREQAQRLSSPPKLLKKSTIYQDLKQVLRHWLYSESFLKEARRIIRRRDPDVLYERYGFGSYVGVKLARSYRLPLILEMNASLSFEGGAYYRRSKLFRIVVRYMERQIALGADNIIVVSDATKRYLLGLGIPESRIYVVPNAVNLKDFRPDAADPTEIRREYGITDRIIVGLVGNFRPWHGADILLQSARSVVARDRRIHFLLVGDGPLRNGLMDYVRLNRLQEYVTFVGRVSHEDVPKYLAAMDITVVPCPIKESFWGSPVKLFEYMAMAKPVVASASGQLASIIDHRRNGILTEPGKAKQLTKAILELASDASLRERLAREAQRTVTEKYTWERNARKIVEIYERLLQAKQSSPA